MHTGRSGAVLGTIFCRHPGRGCGRGADPAQRMEVLEATQDERHSCGALPLGWGQVASHLGQGAKDACGVEAAREGLVVFCEMTALST